LSVATGVAFKVVVVVVVVLGADVVADVEELPKENPEEDAPVAAFSVDAADVVPPNENPNEGAVEVVVVDVDGLSVEVNAPPNENPDDGATLVAGLSVAPPKEKPPLGAEVVDFASVFKSADFVPPNAKLALGAALEVAGLDSDPSEKLDVGAVVVVVAGAAAFSSVFAPKANPEVVLGAAVDDEPPKLKEDDAVPLLSDLAPKENSVLPVVEVDGAPVPPKVNPPLGAAEDPPFSAEVAPAKEKPEDVPALSLFEAPKSNMSLSRTIDRFFPRQQTLFESSRGLAINVSIN
jgi:hypothetical protein